MSDSIAQRFGSLPSNMPPPAAPISTPAPKTTPGGIASRFSSYTPPPVTTDDNAVQPDFLQRAYETSPIKGLVDMAKSSYDAEQGRVQEDDAVMKQVGTFIKQKDWGRAAETLLGHIAKRTGQAFLSNPAVEAVKGVGEKAIEHGGRAINAAKSGNVGETIAQAAEAVPVAGQLAEQIGEPLGKDVREGNVGGAIGDVVGGTASILPLALGGKSEGETDIGAKPVNGPAASTVEPQITKGAKAGIPTVEKVAQPAAGTEAEDLAAQKAEVQNKVQKVYAKETEPAARAKTAELVTKAVQKAEPTAPAMKNFEDAANFYKEKAQKGYKALDDLSRNDYKPATPPKGTGVLDESGKEIMSEGTPEQGSKDTFSDLQRKERQAVRALDFDRADEIRAQKDAMLARYSDKLDPDTIKQANKDWSRGTANEDIHDALTSPAVVGETPDELVANKSAPDPGLWRGKGLLRAIRTLNENETFAKAGMPADSVAQMQELGRVLSKEGNISRFNQVFRRLAAEPDVEESIGKQVGKAITRKGVAAGVGGTIGAIAGGGPIGAGLGAGAGVAVDQWLVPKVFSRVAWTPAASKALVNGLKVGASATAITNALRPYLKEKEEKQ
jgi:hypothetical protein